ncbi:kinase-like protein [Atractiella rhizophila]|nr:kinase-like protein [Atractiella rhizophila]
MSINGRFWIGRKLGAGSFGEVFDGIDLVTGEPIAIKREPLGCSYPSLEEEAKLIKMLAGGSLIPLVLWFGVHGGHRCMVMNLLGPNLWEVLQRNGGKFSIKTVCNIAIRLICRVEYMHNKHLVHRDLKPENIMVGLSRGSIYVCDLGLARIYKHADGKHKQDTHKKVGLCGTARYASLNAHAERAQTRRDDLESLGYMFVEFLLGRLPWGGLGGNGTDEKWARIYKCKQETSLDTLCSALPPQFQQFIQYCRNLGFKDRPDYAFCRGLFETVLAERGMKVDREYDWLVKGSKARSFVVNSPRRVPGVAIALDRKYVHPCAFLL